jgi:hypothetical protein
MTDGQSEWMREADSDPRPIPDERDQIEVPHKPDLRCREHGGVCELMHSFYNRLLKLEQRITVLEKIDVE